MEFNDLIIFKTVAQEGSISKAAKELGYVQPNVTERIKKLEMELGTPLITRTNKGISLLPAGETLIAYTDKIMNLIDDAKNEIKRSGAIRRIGATQSILAGYLSSRIKGSMKDYQLFMDNSERLRELLRQQKIDVAITYADDFEPEFQCIHTSKIKMGLWKAKGHVVSDFSNEVLFVSHDQQCPHRNRTLHFIREHNLSEKQLQYVDSYTVIQDFVASGLGLAFLPMQEGERLEIVDGVPCEELAIYFYSKRESKKMNLEFF
ncbi:LysR family transcriptional regulator [Falsibacillus pallidus]|uniref:LysR family transcriptional regulator n=1 Tax=Falsibacillus pallidus TaxID=493781 RepID=UPI003D997BF7